VESASVAREPHRVAFFLGDLASGFHTYWNLRLTSRTSASLWHIIRHRTGARLFLAAQIGQVVKNGLALMGVEAAEEL